MPEQTIKGLSKKALEIALNEIGNGEEVGNNRGPHVAKYAGTQPIPNVDHGAWCSLFVSWCMVQAGYDPTVHGVSWNRWNRKRRSAKWLFRLVRNTGHSLLVPEPGCLVCWNRGARDSWKGHIGICSASKGEGVFVVVEGNRGAYPSKVGEFRHADEEANLVGYAIP